MYNVLLINKKETLLFERDLNNLKRYNMSIKSEYLLL